MIKRLIVSDKLFRTYDFVQRKKYMDFAEKVKEKSEVFIVSSLHPSGEKINEWGMVCICHGPIIYDDDDESYSSYESSEEDHDLND